MNLLQALRIKDKACTIILDGNTLYEEQTRDGSIPSTVLAYHHSEFVRQAREPGYQPVAVEIRNPRKIEEERKELEVIAAIRKYLINHESAAANAVANTYIGRWGSNDYGLGALMTSLATAPRRDMPTAANVAAAYRVRCPTMQRQSNPSLSAATPMKGPGRDHHIPPRPPVAAANAFARIPDGITGDIWNLVNEIKSLEKNESGLPLRRELRRIRLLVHFHANTGVLRITSPLWRYIGDMRLFSLEEWDYLTEQPTRES